MKYKLTTTLNRLRAAGACEDGYRKLLKSLPPKFDHDAPINLLDILASNGPDDMLWALRCTVENCDIASRHMNSDFAKNMPAIMTNQPVRNFTDGKIHFETWATARESARNAARTIVGNLELATAAYAAQQKTNTKIIRKWLKR